MSAARRTKKTGAAETDWVSRLADEVIADAERRHPGRRIVCASGLSPSGPIHLGNLREVMVPHLVADEIARRGGAVEHILSWDDYDRFRKVPSGVRGVDASWEQYVGRPLTAVPPPPGSAYRNWADHFAAPMRAALEVLGVEHRGISQTRMYTSGAYREQVLVAMRERARIDEVLGRYRTKTPSGPQQAARAVSAATDADSAAAAGLAAHGSGAADEDDGSQGPGAYYPFRPYCAACGRDTTRVLAYEQTSTRLEYACHACGHAGVMHLDRDFSGKLVWKVDWPMRWRYEGVDFEPSGVDHQSPGSSFTVGGQLVTEIFGGHQPLGPMYAFVGISGMAKMSSSRGGVPTPAQALAIMEAPLLRWLYTRRKPHQGFTVAFDHEVQRLYDEWDALERKVARGQAQPSDVAVHARAVGTAHRRLPLTPTPVPYRALTSIVDITNDNPQQMLRILGDFGVRTLDEARPRLDCAQEWVRTQQPEHERTRVLAAPDTATLQALLPPARASLDLLADRLTDDWSLAGLTRLVYGVPKLRAGLDIDEKVLSPAVKAAQRDFFALVYRLLVGADTGPRLPTLLLCVGPQRTRMLLGR